MSCRFTKNVLQRYCQRLCGILKCCRCASNTEELCTLSCGHSMCRLCQEESSQKCPRWSDFWKNTFGVSADYSSTSFSVKCAECDQTHVSNGPIPKTFIFEGLRQSIAMCPKFEEYTEVVCDRCLWIGEPDRFETVDEKFLCCMCFLKESNITHTPLVGSEHELVKDIVVAVDDCLSDSELDRTMTPQQAYDDMADTINDLLVSIIDQQINPDGPYHLLDQLQTELEIHHQYLLVMDRSNYNQVHIACKLSKMTNIVAQLRMMVSTEEFIRDHPQFYQQTNCLHEQFEIYTVCCRAMYLDF